MLYTTRPSLPMLGLHGLYTTWQRTPTHLCSLFAGLHHTPSQLAHPQSLLFYATQPNPSTLGFCRLYTTQPSPLVLSFHRLYVTQESVLTLGFHGLYITQPNAPTRPRSLARLPTINLYWLYTTQPCPSAPSQSPLALGHMAKPTCT